MDREEYSRLNRLEARMRQMEEAIQALCAVLRIDPAAVLPQMEQQSQAISNALMAGNKILAIKLYREQYGVGLKEAKDAIDAMERQNRGY
jgi:ribosomal protein L7/L12